jgi:hypothetical protein
MVDVFFFSSPSHDEKGQSATTVAQRFSNGAMERALLNGKHRNLERRAHRGSEV